MGPGYIIKIASPSHVFHKLSSKLYNFSANNLVCNLLENDIYLNKTGALWIILKEATSSSERSFFGEVINGQRWFPHDMKKNFLYNIFKAYCRCSASCYHLCALNYFYNRSWLWLSPCQSFFVFLQMGHKPLHFNCGSWNDGENCLDLKLFSIPFQQQNICTYYWHLILAME